MVDEVHSKKEIKQLKKNENKLMGKVNRQTDQLSEIIEELP